MKVSVTFEANDLLRRAIQFASGAGDGLASREQLVAHFSQHGVSECGELVEAFRNHLVEQLADGNDSFVSNVLAKSRPAKEPAEEARS